MIYSILGILIGIFAIILSFLRFKEGKMSGGMLAFWLGVWIIVIWISLYPESTTFLANMIGIGRGLDLALILGLIGCYYLIFKMYTMIENIEIQITKIVREIALQREYSQKEEKEKKSLK
ncbi:MAG: DUF2304 family protein [Euryarchaeota archaeon]|nr:DUF2304 family protein [Euryarchaeota archaeon]